MRVNVHSRMDVDQPARSNKKPDILLAALSLFAERGFHGTSVPEIARTAGVAAGTIYRHFESKEALVNELYRRSKAALMAHLYTGLRLDGDLRLLFGMFWGNLASFARSESMAFQFLELHHHGTYLDPTSLDLERGSLEPIAKLLEHSTAVELMKPMPPAAMMSIVWGAFVRLIKSEKEGYLDLDDHVLAQAEQACWDAITR